MYRKDPGQHIRPLCAAVAAAVLDDPTRVHEVREEVERELEQSPQQAYPGSRT